MPRTLPSDPDRLPIARGPAIGRAHRAGFTLVEVLVVMAIVGILSALAYPAYRDHVTRAALMDAVSGLSSLAAQMERHYQDNRSYESVGAFTTPCRADAVLRTFGDFEVDCPPDGLGAATFTLRARGSGLAGGFTFTLDQRGQRATPSAPPGWNPCTSRWLTRRGEPCS